jgi:putative membrane protein
MNDLVLGWQLDPVLIGGILALVVSYALATGPLRSRLAPDTPFGRGRAVAFYGGLVLLYLLEGSPLHDLAERYLFSAHMLQHLAVSYFVAPLLLWGTPTWLLRALLLSRPLAPLSRFLTRPLIAFFTFILFFSIWHLPTIYDGALQNSSLHHSEHFLFLLVSLLLWWPLMSPLPELPRPSYLVQLVYLFTLPIAQLPVFGAITFADHSLYATYALAPRTFGLSVLADQALGGVFMKVLGLFVFGTPFALIFFRWYRREVGVLRRPQRT